MRSVTVCRASITGEATSPVCWCFLLPTASQHSFLQHLPPEGLLTCINSSFSHPGLAGKGASLHQLHGNSDLSAQSILRSKRIPFLTIKQMLTALLQQAADVEWDEELSSKGVPVQVTGQSKGALQDWDQQEPTGRGFPVPALNLRRNSNNESQHTCHLTRGTCVQKSNSFPKNRSDMLNSPQARHGRHTNVLASKAVQAQDIRLSFF